MIEKKEDLKALVSRISKIGQTNRVLTKKFLEKRIENSDTYAVNIYFEELRTDSLLTKRIIKKTFKKREDLIQYLATPFGTKKNFTFEPVEEDRHGIYLKVFVNGELLIEKDDGVIYTIPYFTLKQTKKEEKEGLPPRNDKKKNEMVYNYLI